MGFPMLVRWHLYIYWLGALIFIWWDKIGIVKFCHDEILIDLCQTWPNSYAFLHGLLNSAKCREISQDGDRHFELYHTWSANISKIIFHIDNILCIVIIVPRWWPGAVRLTATGGTEITRFGSRIYKRPELEGLMINRIRFIWLGPIQNKRVLLVGNKGRRLELEQIKHETRLYAIRKSDSYLVNGGPKASILPGHIMIAGLMHMFIGCGIYKWAVNHSV